MTEPKTPPDEILLMRAGKTESMRGTFDLTPEAARANEGKELPIHSSDFNFGDPPAGWGRIQARADGIWLTDISWSKAAKDLLENRPEKCPPIFVSPAFTVVKNKVERIISTSLTASPPDPEATRIE